MPQLSYKSTNIAVTETFDMVSNVLTSITKPTLVFFTKELRYIIADVDSSPNGYSIVFDSYSDELNSAIKDEDSEFDQSLIDVDGQNLYSVKLTENNITLPPVLAALNILNEGHPDAWDIVSINDISAIKINEGYHGINEFLSEVCINDRHFESYMANSDSRTVSGYVNSYFGNFETIYLNIMSDAYPNIDKVTLSSRIAYLEQTLYGPDWNSLDGELGFIKNKPSIPVIPNISEPDWNATNGQDGFIKNKPEDGRKLGGGITFALISDINATANKKVPYSTKDRFGDWNGISCSFGNIVLPKDSGIYHIEATIAGTKTTSPSNDFVECVMTKANGSRIGTNVFGFNGGGSGAGRNLTNTGFAIVDTNGATDNIEFSVKVARRLSDSSIIVGDTEQYHSASAGKIIRIG